MAVRAQTNDPTSVSWTGTATAESWPLRPFFPILLGLEHFQEVPILACTFPVPALESAISPRSPGIWRKECQLLRPGWTSVPDSRRGSLLLPMAAGTPGHRGDGAERGEWRERKGPLIHELELRCSAAVALRAAQGYHVLVGERGLASWLCLREHRSHSKSAGTNRGRQRTEVAVLR